MFRPLFGRILSGTLMAGCALALVTSIMQGGSTALVTVAPWLLLVMITLWAMYWNPRVIVDDGGVRLVNVLATIDIPWPAIQRIDTKWALTLFTAYGKFTAWAAPAPGGIAAARGASKRQITGLPESTYAAGASVRPGDLPSSPSGAAASVVRARWEALRDAGHLDNPRLEFTQVPVQRHWIVLTAIPALIIVGALGTVAA